MFLIYTPDHKDPGKYEYELCDSPDIDQGVLAAVKSLDIKKPEIVSSKIIDALFKTDELHETFRLSNNNLIVIIYGDKETLTSYINKHFDGNKAKFSKAQGVSRQQTNAWINKDFRVHNDVLYSERRKLTKD